MVVYVIWKICGVMNMKIIVVGFGVFGIKYLDGL